MKIFVRFFGVLLLILTFIVTLLVIFDYSYVLRGIEVVYLKGHSTAYIDDFTEFENRAIPAGEEAQPWPYHSNFNNVEPTSKLEETHKDLQTIAFLIIKNDSIWYENYRGGYNANSKSNSFSMAKSITSALLGKAIKDGHIKSIDQPVTDFYPEYKDQFGEKLGVGDLASMSSGLNWDEDYYNPFSQTARVYFDDNIREVVLDLELIDTPGTSFKYLSGNTILLGMVIEKATGKNLSAYLSESFWKPLGMEQDALWQLDSKESGMEKAYCCIASNAKDFARFGKLYKDKGNWKGTQVLDTAFIERSVSPRFEESPEYGYGWWLVNHNNKEVFYMRGVLGQYVIVIPEDDVIIVRLGHKLIKRKEGEDHAPDFYIYIEEALKMLNNDSKA
jgi:CubicO group peptidase (beta-lactamase class C family)